MNNEKLKNIKMEAVVSNKEYEGNRYHLAFVYNNIIIDTADTFDAGWETAIMDRRIGEWYILKSFMNFEQALTEHGKVIYQILSGKRRFKNLDTDKFVKLEVI